MKRCPDCGKQVHRRKIGGKWYDDVHLEHAGTSMECIVMCRSNKLSQMLRIPS